MVLLTLFALAAQAQSPAPPTVDPRVRDLVRAVSAERLRADLTTLVGFGTRHTLSDTVSPTRGIGAARRWIKAEFERIAAACGGCLEVFYVEQVYDGLPRVPRPTNVVSVVAVQRGTTDPQRFLVMSGHFDSRVSDAQNAVDSAPGANDDGSGTVAVIEAARVLSRHRFNASIAYATLAGEEQGLLGGRRLAQYARDVGWRIAGVLNNDIVGNITGVDGITDSTMVRVFSDAVPPEEPERDRVARRGAGGEVDGVSRQLARYVDRIAERYLPAFDVWMIWRHDRFGRGGDHRPFADLGWPAVRISEGHEFYARQHQDIRVAGDTAYGDVLAGVHFPYLAKVTALNAASLASLAWAPGPPRAVRVSGAGRPAARLTWEAPADSGNVAGYRVYWRRTDAPTWDQSAWVGNVREYVATGRVLDNWYFGVASVSREGHESPVVFPGVSGGN
jgi:Zn-dependent M28 family amino/carboxypeptidase